jgi:NCAIR mutase (PurE)-related protein
VNSLAKQDAYLFVGIGLAGILALWYIRNNAASIGAGAVTAVGDLAGGMASATGTLIAAPVVALSSTAPFQTVGGWIGSTVYDLTHWSQATDPTTPTNVTGGATGGW